MLNEKSVNSSQVFLFTITPDLLENDWAYYHEIWNFKEWHHFLLGLRGQGKLEPQTYKTKANIFFTKYGIKMVLLLLLKTGKFTAS